MKQLNDAQIGKTSKCHNTENVTINLSTKDPS